TTRRSGARFSGDVGHHENIRTISGVAQCASARCSSIFARADSHPVCGRPGTSDSLCGHGIHCRRGNAEIHRIFISNTRNLGRVFDRKYCRWKPLHSFQEYATLGSCSFKSPDRTLSNQPVSHHEEAMTPNKWLNTARVACSTRKTLRVLLAC